MLTTGPIPSKPSLMFQSTPFIDDEGNLHLYTQEGGICTFEFTDENDVPRNMSAAFVWFETIGLRKRLTFGAEPQQLILTIQAGELNHLLNKPTPYVIIDETGSVPHVLFAGTVAVTGFIS